MSRRRCKCRIQICVAGFQPGPYVWHALSRCFTLQILQMDHSKVSHSLLISVANPPGISYDAVFCAYRAQHLMLQARVLPSPNLASKLSLDQGEKALQLDSAFFLNPQARVCGHGGEPTSVLLLLWGKLLQRKVHTPTRRERTRWANSEPSRSTGKSEPCPFLRPFFSPFFLTVSCV